MSMHIKFTLTEYLLYVKYCFTCWIYSNLYAPHSKLEDRYYYYLYL